MMNKKLLLCWLAITVFIAGCHKSETISPITGPSTPVVPPTPVTVFNLSNVLQDNMVIQRDKPFLLWGQLTAGHTATVTVSWNPTKFSGVADSYGNWKVTIPAAPANSSAQSVTCTTGGFADVGLKNILIGDVWICSGQSNMTMQMAPNATFTGVLNYQSEINAANYPNIRASTVTQDLQNNPVSEFTYPNNWVTCTPQTTGNISAVAYYFARKINTSLNVPVGIIVSSINGSWCESWINGAMFSNDPDIGYYGGINNATMLYNGMINPLINLQIKGFLWYQGENNQKILPVSDYTRLNSDLIKGWRTMFKNDQLPFYLVQLTPFADDYYVTVPVGGDLTKNWLAYFREAQANVLNVANTGMAITMDVGEAANHHPQNKKPVGERLALLALKNTYAQSVTCDGPKYAGYSISGNIATIRFVTGTADGLTTSNGQALNQLFFAAGNDHVFRQASAQLSGNTVIVTASAATSLPLQAIRYAFTNAAITNIQNSAGLPMEPFRTDNWNN